MAESDRAAKLSERSAELEKRISLVDERIPSPSQRAEYVWRHLRTTAPDLTDWDILCFAVEYIAMMTPVYPWLLTSARAVAQLVYTAHYAMFSPETKRSGIGHEHSNSESGARDRREKAD